MNVPEEAKCPRAILHQFEVSGDYPDAHVDFCIHCGKREIAKKDKNGRIDNESYIRSHFRDFLQPTGDTRRLYIEVYGSKGLQEREDAAKKKKAPISKEQLREEAQDFLKTMKNVSTRTRGDNRWL